MDLDLKDRVILVTGGGSGIGEAITRACLAEQAQVVVAGRTTARVAELQRELQGSDARCHFLEAELADPEACRKIVAEVEARHGRLDGLVNNAGANDSIGLAHGDPARFMRSLEQNLLHYYAMAHYSLSLLKQSQGSIVNVSSKVALTGQGGTSAYAAAKGAQLALTREWAAELLPFNIRVNSVLPAEVQTPLYQQWLAGLDAPEAALDQIKRQVPLGQRMTLPEEIAATVVFLLSNKQSGHTTGQHLSVDGGYTHLDRALTAR